MFYPDPATAVTVAPYLRTVGHEAEYSSGANLANELMVRKLSPQTGLRAVHHSHCTCTEADRYPLHSVSDSSAHGGEYHIGGNRGVVYGSPQYGEAVRLLCEHASTIGCGTLPSVGMHTHVGTINPKTGIDLSDVQRVELLRIYLRYETQIHALSSGPLDEPRNNHHTPKMLNQRGLVSSSYSVWDTPSEIVAKHIYWPGKATLNFVTGRNTIEFRIWNATKAAWRMHLAAGISTAIVEAAAQGRTVTRETPATILEFLRDLLTPDIALLAKRQLEAKNKTLT